MIPEYLNRYIEPLLPIPTGLAAGGRLQAPVQALMFDIYGTLFISGSGDIGTTETVTSENSLVADLLKRYAIPWTALEIGEKLREAILASHESSKLQGIDYPEVDIETIWAAILPELPPDRRKRFALEYEMAVNPVYPMPHLEEACAQCRARKLPMGVISNAQFYTPMLFEWFLGKDLPALGFAPDLTVFSWQEGAAKPSPVLFEKAIRRIHTEGISPPHVLYVGNDMRNDVWAAQNAGFQTALFAADRRSLRKRSDDPQVADCSPDIVLTDLMDLFRWLPDSVD